MKTGRSDWKEQVVSSDYEQGFQDGWVMSTPQKLKDLILSHPNDQELGREVRRLFSNGA